ncbi:hypothetical protein V493_01252 [Pseudogymnoascus sp. VKM F-4281 (FW-2241)]|nr:hypothetical protein V493_01252 [Pseudogymnoascus sp. VKM F-4281 (FW-2241)]
MSRAARMRNLSIREPEDNAFGPTFSSSTVSAPPFQRPRGRSPKKPRTALAYKISEQVSHGKACQEQVDHGQISYKISGPQIVSPSTPIIAIPSSSSLRALRSAVPGDHTATHNVVHKLGKKRKRTLSEEVRPTDLQTACEGCRRTIYPHGGNQGQDLVIICYKCSMEWHAMCMVKEGIKRCEVPGQWECRNCSRKGQTLPSQPAHTDDTQADVMMLDQQPKDAANKIALSVPGLSSNIVYEELYMPRTTDHGDHPNVSKIAVIQAQTDYKVARRSLRNVLRERETCRELLNKLKSEIEQFVHELDEHRRHFNSDGVYPNDGESKHSMTQRLVLGISGDRDWTDKISAKIDLIRAEERGLTERVKSLQGDVKMKKAILKVVEQRHSAYSTRLETSYRAFDKLRSIITIDFEDDVPQDSDCSLVSTMEDSVADSATNPGCDEITHSDNADISPNGVARGVEPLAEEANQQHMTTQSIDGRDDLKSSQLSEDTERLHRGPSRPPLMVLLQTNAQWQPAVCTTPGAIQVSPAEEREQEGTSQPSNITLHMSSNSDLVEGRNQRRDVSLAISIAQEPDKSYPTEGCGRNFIPAALPPSSEDVNPLKPSEASDISLVQEATALSIRTGDRCSEDPHIPRSALEGMTRSAENQNSADVIKQRQEHQYSRQAEASTSISASYEDFPRSKTPPPFLGLTSSPSAANPVHNTIVLPPITSFSPTRDALQPSALLSLTPPTRLRRMSISSNTLGQYTTNGNLQTPVLRETTVQEIQEQLPLIQTQTPPLQATACTAASPHVNLASTVTEAHGEPGNTDGSLNRDSFLRNLQLVKDWITTIDPNFVTRHMLSQKPALSTISDIPVTTEGQVTVRPGCACESHRYLYKDWPTRDAELVIGSCMRHCMYCDKNIHMPGNLRKHLIRSHADLNLRIHREQRSGGTVIPGWKPLPTTATPDSQSTSTPVTTEGQLTVWPGCACESHRNLYEDWPTRDAELVIGSCMRHCMYCGKNIHMPGNLRTHLIHRHADLNLRIRKEKRSGGKIIPGWKPLPTTAIPDSQSTSTPLGHEL